MKKTVIKMLSVEPFDMRGLEEWFSAMAAQGLYLSKVGESFARFDPGPPQPETRYALDVKDWADIDPERNDLYAQAGWEFVTTLKGLYYVYRTADPDAPALHTDPVTQSFTIQKLLRRRLWTLVVIILYTLFLLRDTLFPVFTDPWYLPRLMLLKTEIFLLYPLLLACCVLPTVAMFRQLWALKALKRQLADGIPLDESRRWPVRIPRGVVSMGLYALLLCVTVAALLLEPRQAQRLYWPDEWDFPYVTLEQSLEGTDTVRLTLESPASSQPPTLRRSLLVPEQIDWSQSGTAVRSNGKQEDCGIFLDLYRLRFPDMAPLLLRCVQESCLAGWRRYEKNTGELYPNPKLVELSDFQNVDHPAFDQLTVLTWRTEDEESPQTRYIGRVGDLVFDLTCSGPASADHALDIFEREVLS